MFWGFWGILLLNLLNHHLRWPTGGTGRYNLQCRIIQVYKRWNVQCVCVTRQLHSVGVYHRLHRALEVVKSNWVFPKIGVPQNGWFTMENPIKMDDLGGTIIFGNTQLHSPKLTFFDPEKWWLGDDPFLLGRLIFRGCVSFREGIWLQPIPSYVGGAFAPVYGPLLNHGLWLVISPIWKILVKLEIFPNVRGEK